MFIVPYGRRAWWLQALILIDSLGLNFSFTAHQIGGFEKVT